MAPLALPQGTKEYVHVDVDDELNNVTDLATVSPVTFTVRDANDVAKITDQAAVVSGMRASCMVDTNAGGVWAAGNYYLTLKFTATPEIPVLGPVVIPVLPRVPAIV